MRLPLALLVVAHAAKNEPIGPNKLGVVATDCAEYCAHRDPLQVWLALENVCFPDTKQPYFVDPNAFTSFVATPESPSMAFTLASGIVGLVVGYAAGTAWTHKRLR